MKFEFPEEAANALDFLGLLEMSGSASEDNNLQQTSDAEEAENAQEQRGMSRVVNQIENSLQNWGRYFESPREALNEFFVFDSRYKALIAQYADNYKQLKTKADADFAITWRPADKDSQRSKSPVLAVSTLGEFAPNVGEVYQNRKRTPPEPVSYTHLTLPTICSV